MAELKLTGKEKADDIINQALEAYPDDPYMAWVSVQQARERADQESTRTKQPRNLELRDAEHWLLARRYGPVGGLAGELGYSTLKALTQSLPRSWGLPFQDSTPPDPRGMMYGIKGGFGVR